MSITVTCPFANAIALGGVAPGSMKAKEQAKVPGSIRKSGLIPILSP